MSGSVTRPLRIAVLIKQIPAFEEMTLGDDGRLVRDGLDTEIDPFCRRAIAQGVALAGESGGICTIVTMGPPPAVDALREALACGATSAVLVSDPVLAGSDSLVTARALVAALRRKGPFDLVLTGLHAVDSDTGQVGPEIAELLGLPFVSGVRKMELIGERLQLGCERDDGWVRAEVTLPVLLSVAERLCAPAKAAPDRWPPVDSHLIDRVGTAELGEGPWGEAGSPTRVGRTRLLVTRRQRRRLSGPIKDQVSKAVALLDSAGVLDADPSANIACPRTIPLVSAASEVFSVSGDEAMSDLRIDPNPQSGNAGTVAILVEPERPRLYAEIIRTAVHLVKTTGGDVVALVPAGSVDPMALLDAGANRVIKLCLPDGSPPDEEGFAAGAGWWATATPPWAVLVPSTSWGRHVAGRMAARLGMGLIGDAVEIEVADSRLLAWKPAFGGQLVAAVTSISPVQMVTLRPGLTSHYEAEASAVGRKAVAISEMVVLQQGPRVKFASQVRDPTADIVPLTRVLIGVGQGVDPNHYSELDQLLHQLSAELVGTRKVTDFGWLPKTRQIGVTGHSVSPRLYIAIGISGKFNHTIGVRRAEKILAINSDPSAPIFDSADIGITADWRKVVPHLTRELMNREQIYQPNVSIPSNQ